MIFAAFVGFFIAAFIYHKKRNNETMVCPLNFTCDTVVRSDYSKFFGVPVEILGMAYYGIVAVFYAVFLLFPFSLPSSLIFSVFVLSVIAFLFSLYLTFVQVFQLREWCSWCLMSAGLCTLIFITVVLGSDFGFFALLAEHKQVFVLFHAIGAAIGVGGATIADVFFFKFLKDFRISEFESGVMHTFSQVIWFALLVLLLTGLGIYLPSMDVLHATSTFLVKVIVVAVILMNGAILNLYITPRLVKISFHERHRHESGELRHVRKLAFVLGAISLTSWYSAFLLGTLRGISVSFYALLSLYVFVLCFAVIVSQVLERFFIRSAKESED